jgi:hypothetical protein
MKIELTDNKIRELLAILGMSPDKKGYYQTNWGKKSEAELFSTIKAILGYEGKDERKEE